MEAKGKGRPALQGVKTQPSENFPARSAILHMINADALRQHLGHDPERIEQIERGGVKGRGLGRQVDGIAQLKHGDVNPCLRQLQGQGQAHRTRTADDCRSHPLRRNSRAAQHGQHRTLADPARHQGA